MSIEQQNYRETWTRQLRQMEKLPSFGKSRPEPLEVTNSEILQAVKEELDYVFKLDPVKRDMENTSVNKITIKLQKGEETKKDLLQHTPRTIVIDNIKRDDKGNIIEKTLILQREARYCHFTFSNTPDGETMNIGENNLDSGYNKGILGWTETGIKLFKNAIEQDHYIPITNLEVTHPDISTPSTDVLSTEQTIDVKGPMEI